MHWWRGSGRRVGLEVGLHLFDRAQLAVHQFEEEIVEQPVVDRQLGNDAHLLHESVGNPLPGLGPLGEEALELRLDSGVLRGMGDPEDRFRLG